MGTSSTGSNSGKGNLHSAGLSPVHAWVPGRASFLSRLVAVFFFLCPVCFSLSAEAELPPLYREPVAQIEVTGLFSISPEELLYLLDISKGRILDPSGLRTGIKRAFLKGIFDDIIVESSDAAHSVIRITVKEKAVIDSLKIFGNNHFSKRFIRRLLNIKEGERLNHVKLKEGLDALKSGFSKRGFPVAEVSYQIVPQKKYKIELKITVKEGAPETIKEIIITESGDELKSALGLKVGDILDQAKLDRIKEKLIARSTKQGFVGSSLTQSFKDGVLRMAFDKGNKLTISFEGNSAIGTGKLMNEINFFEINEFNEDLVEETVARMIGLYHKSGYPLARVAPVVSSSEDALSLQFFVFEGDRYTVDSIEFRGASLPHDKLREILALYPGGPYNPDALDSDKDTLTEFYHALGYIFESTKDPEVKMHDTRVSIEYEVDEGQQVRIAKILMKNNQHFSEDTLLAAMKLKKGDPYNEVDILDARRKILEFYQNHGFPDAKVNFEFEVSGASANITFVITEGSLTRYGKAVIAGNEQTKLRAIRREFLHKEGEPFNYSLLFDERHRLYRTGLFNDVDIAPVEKTDSETDILYRVKEANPGAVEFAVGYGEFEKYRGYFDLSYKNLWGMNRQASLRTELSSIDRRVILSYLEPWFLGYELPFKAFILFESKRELNFDTHETLYKLTRYGASAGIEKNLTPTLKSETYYELSLVNTFDIQPGVVLSKEDTGTLLISGVKQGFVYDTRDNPFDPSKGILVGVSFKVASKYILSETDFGKVGVFVNKYQSLGSRFVLAGSARVGVARGFGKTDELPIVERFFLGGRTTVRGYAQDSLGPKDSSGNPIGGNAFAMANIELRTKLGKGFGIVTFVDAGNVWLKVNQMTASLKYTTGLGLRYNTPVGPLSVDYGFKLNREQGESHGEIHFSIGQAF